LTDSVVLWVGQSPEEEIPGCSVTAVGDLHDAQKALGAGMPSVVHLHDPDARTLRRARRMYPSAALVVDLCARTEPPKGALRRALADADLTLVPSAAAARAFRTQRRPLPAVAVRRPLDLGVHAPIERLRETRDAEWKRFRRLHRIGPPVVLFAGPYVEGGGLAALIEAAELLRVDEPDLRVAAVPFGEIDRRELDRCERRILSFGHRGIVRFTVAADELPLWFATADVVCLPAAVDVDPRPADHAAAAGRPVVATQIGSLQERVEDGVTGLIVPVGDAGALAHAVLRLLRDKAEADRLGGESFRRAQRDLDPAVYAERLRELWAGALEARNHSSGATAPASANARSFPARLAR
jgi:glycosyltransferase involved in cell wall biosynthesis